MADESGRVLAFPQAPDAIELRHLRAFVAVAEELNFSRAAERLHISQPALSRQVRALERLLGCELLRRSTHQVELTLAGEAFLDRTRQLLSDVDEAVSATQSLGGQLNQRLAQLWAPVFAAAIAESDIEERRSAVEALFAQFPPPPEVAVHPVNAGGVPSFRVSADPDLAPTILYLHGGGHVLGSAYGYRGLIGALAIAAGACALAPEYRLAPENPFPADLEDAERAYRWLLDTGADPQRLLVAGDSSGAGLVMSLLLSLREKGVALPGGALLFCPWVDLTGSTLRIHADGEAAEMMIEHARVYVDPYLDGHPIDDPLVSPLNADLAAMPQMLIQSATGDPQREDAHLLAERARSHGVEVKLELYPVETHAFQTFWSFLPEAREALEQAGGFARSVAAGKAARRGGQALPQ